MVTDANVYWLPNELFSNQKLMDQFIRSIRHNDGVYVYTKKMDNDSIQFVIEEPKGYESLNYMEKDYDFKKQLEDMDNAHIDYAIMKLPGCQKWLDLDLCIQFNDGMAKCMKESNGRMKALAVIPPVGGEEVFRELDRCIHKLHMHGVQLSSHYGNKYLDDPIFRPVLRKIHELNVPVYVHHSPVPVEYKSIAGYNNLRRSYGRCIDQTIAVGRELFSGMFEELPNLKMIHSMLGGGIFAFTNSWFPKHSGNGRFNTNTEKIKNYLKNNIYFEVSHAQPWGKAQLECAVKVLGAEKIIYGSSYPVKSEWLTDGPAFVNQLGISQEEKDLILWKNAQEIYQFENRG